MSAGFTFVSILSIYYLSLVPYNVLGDDDFICGFIDKGCNNYSTNIIPDNNLDHFIQEADSLDSSARNNSEMYMRANSAQLQFKDILWPNGVVPIKFDLTGKLHQGNGLCTKIFCYKGIPKKYQSRIWKALRMISDNTCIRFVKKRNFDKDFIFIKLGDHDSTYIGCIEGRQKAILALRTQTKILHSIMHVLGLVHKHQSINRDKYVTINESNIQDGFRKDFKILPDLDQSFGATYEYDSGTHYSNTQGAVDPTRNTISAKDPDMKLDGSFIISPGDVWKINAMYKCPGFINLNVICNDHRKIQ